LKSLDIRETAKGAGILLFLGFWRWRRYVSLGSKWD